MCPLSDARRELVIAGIAVMVVIIGVVVDVASDPVRSGPSTTTSTRLVERAVYCSPGAEGAAEVRIAAVPSDPDSEVGALVSPLEQEPVTLPAGGAIVRSVPDGLAQSVIGRGSTVLGGASTFFTGGPIPGTASSRCSRAAGSRWYFAAGSSALSADDRLLVHNPFPEDAVVGVRFVTPDGERSPANAADLPIASGESLELKVNDFVTAERVLSAIVTADRGRVIVWRLMLEAPEGLPEGVVATLGARGPAPTWYFPAGHVGTGAREVISVLNPSDREALVTVSLATSKGAVQPRRLAEVRVPPRTSTALSLPDSVSNKQAELGGASAIVSSSNNVEIVAERTVYYSGPSLKGIESEVGARSPSTGWVLPALSADASIDRLLLLNAGTDPATLSVTLYRAKGRPLQPEPLQNVQLRPGLRKELSLDDIEGAGQMVAVVTASAPIVAERQAMSSGTSDVTSIMGIGMAGGQADAA